MVLPCGQLLPLRPITTPTRYPCLNEGNRRLPLIALPSTLFYKPFRKYFQQNDIEVETISQSLQLHPFLNNLR